MSGDVFGNGMLLSRHIRLLAAFDHRHIFIDPTPDPAASLAERKRLFDLPRSSWADYDKALISAGGGVFDRARQVDRAVARGARAARRRGADADAGELMRAILTAPVDLLWFGGIGTYVKARARATPRSATAPTTRCASTPTSCAPRWWARAPTSASPSAAASRPRCGGRDQHRRHRQLGRRRHLGPRGQHQDRDRRGDRRGLLARAERDPLLVSMTDEVAALVLRDNYQQSQAISVAAEQAAEEHDRLARFMRALERQGRLDRAVEFLPDAAAMRARGAEPAGPDAARARGAAGLRQDRPLRRDPATRTCPTIRCSTASCALLPDAAAGEVPSRRSAPTGCAARSSPCRSPTRW